MSYESDIRQGRHCVFKLHVHLVFVAKYRRSVFDAQAIDVLRAIFADAHATLVQMDGEDNHVHVLSASKVARRTTIAAADANINYYVAEVKRLLEAG